MEPTVEKIIAKKVVKSEAIQTVDLSARPAVSEAASTISYEKLEPEVAEQATSPAMPDTVGFTRLISQEISFRAEQSSVETGITLTETPNDAVEPEPDYAKLLEQDLSTEISDTDLETIISRWKTELTDDITSDAEGVAVLTYSDTIDVTDTLPQLVELDDIGQPANIEIEAVALAEHPELQTIEPVPDNVPPVVDALTTQLALKIETLNPEAATEVHALIEAVLQEIEQLQNTVAEMLSVEPDAVSESTTTSTPDGPTQEAIDLIKPVSIITTENKIAQTTDKAALEAAIEHLYNRIGLDYTSEDIRQLINQLIASTAALPKENTDIVTADNDWGTHESLQWFSQQLRTMRRQTNLWHNLIGRVGRSALTSLASMQPAVQGT